jgi:hypothetical protein
MCDSLVIDTKKIVLKNIEQLKVRAALEGKILTQKRGCRNVSVLEAFDVQLGKKVAILLSNRLLFKKKHKKRLPQTCINLIECCGGLSYAIYELRLYQQCELSFEDDGTIEYVDMLEYIFTLAKGMTPQRELSRDRITLPFCALCWRRTFASEHYCKQHHPSRNPKSYKSSKHRLITAIEKHSERIELKDDLYFYRQNKDRDSLLANKLYAWTASFSTPINEHNKELKNIKNLSVDEICKVLVEIIVSSYPKVSHKIVFPSYNREKKLSDWVVECIAAADEIDANLWKFKDQDLWLKKASNLELAQTFLNAISRMEAKITIDSFPVHFGPKKGSGENEELRAKILDSLEKQHRQGKKSNIAEIAREFGLSRQRVHKIIKDMKGRGE